jgi:glycerol uptake facilitator-like aquaporin
MAGNIYTFVTCVTEMDDQLVGVALGLLGGGVVTVVAWLLLQPGFFLLSGLGVVWVGAIAAMYPQRDRLDLSFGKRTKREIFFTVLLLYVVTALQNGVSLSPERALVVALVAVGMFVVGIGLRSAQTADT